MGRLTAAAPAPVLETRRLARACALLKPDTAWMMVVQVLACDTVGLWLGARLVAVLFLYAGEEHDAGGRPIVDFATVNDRAAELRGLAGEALGLARLTLVRRLQDADVAIRAMVAVENTAGHRMASVLRFRPIDAGAGVTVYHLTREDLHGRHDFEPVRRRRR